jgi:CBS domain-containing protein
MLLVADVMSQVPISVPAHASIDVAIDLMVENNISGLPVVDEDGNLVGLITEFDVLDLYGSTHGQAATAESCAEFMTSKIRTIQKSASLAVAAQVFQNARFRRLLVLDSEKLVGILSRRDVVRSIRDGRLVLAQ